MNKQKRYPPTTLALRINETYYGLFLIEKGDDESLYIKFPRINGYSIKSHNEFVLIPKMVKLKENVLKIYDPYASYHQSGILHINAKSEGKKKISFIKDKTTTKKLALLQKTEYMPFCSILLPVNILNYDVINHLSIEEFNYHEISDNPLYYEKDGLLKPGIIVVDRATLPNNVQLYVEIFIHKKLDDSKEVLEFSNLQKLNMLEQITVNNNLAELSYTMLIKFITVNKENPKGEIVLNIFNSENMIMLSFV